jgi:hypothetical protein
MARLFQIGFLFLLLAVDWAFDTDQGTNCLSGRMSSQLSLGHNQPVDSGSSEYEGHSSAFALLDLPLDPTTIALAINLSDVNLNPRFHGLIDFGYLFMCLRR